MRQWNVWLHEEGDTSLHLHSRPMSGSARLLRSFPSKNWLTAWPEAFGESPPIDRPIAPLVTVLNDLPGVMTFSSCAGHAARQDEQAYVTLHFDDPAALQSFIERIQFVDTEQWFPFCIDLQLEWARSVSGGQLEMPPGALSLRLILYEEDEEAHRSPPSPQKLARFAKTLKEQR